MWFRTDPTDLSFVDRSPKRLSFESAIYAPAERIFDVFTSDDVGAWLPDFESLEWTSPGPHGVGSTRIMRLKTIAVKERFLVWERGRRVTFAIEAQSVPLLTRMIEDFQLEPMGPRHTRVRYDIHYAPRLLARPIHPIARLFFGRMFREALRAIGDVAVRASVADGPTIHA
jgi:hypothetical protein